MQSNDRLMELTNAVDDIVNPEVTEEVTQEGMQELTVEKIGFFSSPVPTWLFLLTSAVVIGILIFGR